MRRTSTKNACGAEPWNLIVRAHGVVDDPPDVGGIAGQDVPPRVERSERQPHVRQRAGERKGQQQSDAAPSVPPAAARRERRASPPVCQAASAHAGTRKMPCGFVRTASASASPADSAAPRWSSTRARDARQHHQRIEVAEHFAVDDRCWIQPVGQRDPRAAPSCAAVNRLAAHASSTVSAMPQSSPGSLIAAVKAGRVCECRVDPSVGQPHEPQLVECGGRIVDGRFERLPRSPRRGRAGRRRRRRRA